MGTASPGLEQLHSTYIFLQLSCPWVGWHTLHRYVQQAMPPLHKMQRHGEEGNMKGQEEERRAVCLPSFCYALFQFNSFNTQV